MWSVVYQCQHAPHVILAQGYDLEDFAILCSVLYDFGYDYLSEMSDV